MASSECRGESTETTRMRKRPHTFFCGHCNKEVSKARSIGTGQMYISRSGKVRLKTSQTMALLLAFSRVQVPGKLGEKVLVLPPWMALILVMVCLKCFQLFYDVYI